MTVIGRYCVILFVDISGSSRLYQQLGDAAAHRRVRGCLEMIRSVVAAQGGRVIKNIGDGLMCEFADADPALKAAEAMQSAVEDEAVEQDRKLGIHVGCHYGAVVETADDLFGDAVNVAARVMDIAREGQIIATMAIAERLSEPLQRNIRLLRDVTVKGRPDALTAMEYVWRAEGEFTVVAPAAATASRRLRLHFNERELWLGGSGPSEINLGRDIGCEISVFDPEASRLHATIARRGDKFVLEDHSSNGTYVASDGAPEMCLKREEMILPPRGRIGLGLSTTEARATVVEFSTEP